MYILENTMLKKALIGLSLSTSLFLTSAVASQSTYIVQSGDTIGIIIKKLGFNSIDDAGIISVPSGNLSKIFTGDKIVYTSKNNTAVDGAALYETKNGKYTSYHVNTQKIDTSSFGRTPSQTEIAAWNIDVMPDGTGLPQYDMKHGKPVLDSNGNKIKAQGSVEAGNELYDEKCSMCHGEFGSGGKGYPTLSGGDIESLTNQLLNPADKEPNMEPPSRRIGSYWPYASTLYWYIQDAMPFPHPKSLTNSQTYAITAYLLMENGVTVAGEELEDEFILSKDNFKDIEMPNKKGFYPNVDTPNNPQQGVDNITKYLSNPKNYGQGTRCMNDCIKGKIPVLHIKSELTGIEPAPSTIRDWPKAEDTQEKSHPGQKIYEETCSACHANAAIGAPVVGDVDRWKEVLEKGLDTVYENGINGINAMPPKGGNMDLSDAKFKEVVDYMIESSK